MSRGGSVRLRGWQASHCGRAQATHHPGSAGASGKGYLPQRQRLPRATAIRSEPLPRNSQPHLAIILECIKGAQVRGVRIFGCAIAVKFCVFSV